MRISVLGMGSWGLALASLLDEIGHDVMVWGRQDEKVQILAKTRVSAAYLPTVKLAASIQFTGDLERAIHHQEIIILSVSSQGVKEVMLAIDPMIEAGQIIISTSKGLERETFRLMSEVIEKASSKAIVVVLSGPSHAEEVAKRLPTTVAVASKDPGAALLVQDIFMHETFRVYMNDDILGVEIGGALKNIISLAAGISDGMGYGDNTKAALIVRGIVEIARLGEAMGGKMETFYGLSGIGDLIVTCISSHSRNWKTGFLLGQGKTLEEALETVHMVVEGIHTTEAAFKLSERHLISMPITTAIYETLFEGKDPKVAVNELMTRDKKSEN